MEQLTNYKKFKTEYMRQAKQAGNYMYAMIHKEGVTSEKDWANYLYNLKQEGSLATAETFPKTVLKNLKCKSGDWHKYYYRFLETTDEELYVCLPYGMNKIFFKIDLENEPLVVVASSGNFQKWSTGTIIELIRKGSVSRSMSVSKVSIQI